ncbi:MAG: hypothetical protein ACWGSQ_10265, partial [Longimicrobiales bacterium]
RGTHAFLKKNGIEAQLVKKLGFGRPDLVDAIKTGAVTLVVNTPSGKQSQEDDAHIRKTAIRYNIPNITTPAAALWRPVPNSSVHLHLSWSPLQSHLDDPDPDLSAQVGYVILGSGEMHC